MENKSTFSIIKVENAAHEKAFLAVPLNIYTNDKHWIRPLDQDINAVFDRSKNVLFKDGDACRWLLSNPDGQYVGRVAAFFDNKSAFTHSQPTGGMGFFECINNQVAANLLFDSCKAWLIKQGMEAMDGPINFGERNNWWGLLLEGNRPPNYCCNYHPPYYKTLFENYGFKIFFNQFTYHRDLFAPLNPIVAEKAERIYSNPDYSFEHLKKDKLKKFTADFREIYNKGWGKFAGVKPMTAEQASSLMAQMKPIMDERLIWFAYYKQMPAGFFIMMPDLNQLIKGFNGKLHWFNKLRLLYRIKTNVCKKSIGVIFGIVPEHQGKGLEAGLAVAYGKNVVWKKTSTYVEMEMNWIGDFNPAMMRVASQMGGKICKTHATYRLLFDPNKTFERAKRL